jgi:hypothetical protein
VTARVLSFTRKLRRSQTKRDYDSADNHDWALNFSWFGGWELCVYREDHSNERQSSGRRVVKMRSLLSSLSPEAALGMQQNMLPNNNLKKYLT